MKSCILGKIDFDEYVVEDLCQNLLTMSDPHPVHPSGDGRGTGDAFATETRRKRTTRTTRGKTCLVAIIVEFMIAELRA